MCGGEGSELEGNFIKPLILEREKKCKCNRLSGPIVAFYYFSQLSLSPCVYTCLKKRAKGAYSCWTLCWDEIFYFYEIL